MNFNKILLLPFLFLFSSCSIIPSSSNELLDSLQSQTEKSDGDNNSNEASTTIDVERFHKELSQVKIKYESGYAITDYGSNLNLDSSTFYNKEQPKEVVKKLVAGDLLEIYYDDTLLVDHVIVSKAELTLIRISAILAPGAKETEKPTFFSDIEGIVINGSKCDFIINEDGTYQSILDHDGSHSLYGVYSPNENKRTSEFTELITLHAVYSYLPR